MEAWFLLAMAALAALGLELVTGTMVLLSLALTCAALAILSWWAGLGLAALGAIGAALWLGLSLALRRMFGSWGSSRATDDPNDYARDGRLGA